jgi:hypothetical protein
MKKERGEKKQGDESPSKFISRSVSGDRESQRRL